MIKVSGQKELEPLYENVKEGERSRLVKGKRRNVSDLKGMCLSFKKAERELGWSPKVELEEGIKAELAWYQTNKERWSKIIYTD